MHLGWYLAAHIDELGPGLNGLELEGRRLIALRRGRAVEVYDADCPHRGANLAHGELRGKAVVCAFHARAIALGTREHGLFVRAYRVIVAGGLVFVRDPDGIDAGFERALQLLGETHDLLPLPARVIAAPPQLVIENAFDSTHFQPVHGVVNPVNLTQIASDAAYAASGTFVVPASPWQRGSANAALPFVATAYSPSIVVSSLGGTHPYTTITSARSSDGGALVRIVGAIEREATANGADVGYLLQQLDAGIDADEAIWAEVREPAQPAFFAEDATVVGFRAFAARFRTAAP